MIFVRLGVKRVTGLPPAEGSLNPSRKEDHMTKFITKFAKDESGATAIEYGLIAALIAVVIITGVTLVGTSLETTFNNIAGNLGGTVGKA